MLYQILKYGGISLSVGILIIGGLFVTVVLGSYPPFKCKIHNTWQMGVCFDCDKDSDLKNAAEEGNTAEEEEKKKN